MRGFVKKKALRLDSTELSSSEETAPSKAPKDLLGLGTHLVHELGLRDSTDTMGRWLAHHLAELIYAARNKKGPHRLKARNQAAELILKIWERRASLPGKANPLAEYRDILRVLRCFSPNSNPWSQVSGAQHHRLAARIYDRLCRLVIGIVLLDASATQTTRRSRRKRKTSTRLFLSPEERAVLEYLEHWPNDLIPVVGHLQDTKQRRELDVPACIRIIIDDTIKHLEELRKALTDEGRGVPSKDGVG